MNTPIKTNELKYTIHEERLMDRYEFYKLTTTEKYFSYVSYLLDAPLLKDNVCSIVYESGKSCYLLMNKAAGNLRVLRESLREYSDFQYITISAESCSSIPAHILLQLLLNSMGTYSGSLKANNLTGHLYCYNTKSIKRRGEAEKSFAVKIPALEIRVSSEMKLLLDVRTFTSVRLKRQMEFTSKRSFEKYPQYVFGKNYTLRRKLKTDDECGYIIKQTRGDKSSMAFLNLKNYEDFENSKMGILHHLLNAFHEKYSGLAEIDFQTVTDYTSIAVKSSIRMLREIKPVICEYLTEQNIKIVDQISDEHSFMCCQMVSDALQCEYGVTARIGRRVDKQALNICLIHNAEYYARLNMPDPHDDDHRGAAVQHITYEDFIFDSVYAVRTVVQELLVKQDVRKGQIRLYDWASLGCEGKMAFMIAYPDQSSETHYFCMEIEPDGHFSISEKQYSPFKRDEYAECIEAFQSVGSDESKLSVIRFPTGDINIIRDTSIFTIPELDEISHRLQSGDTYLRNQETRDALLSSILDIKGYAKEDKMYYFSGYIGSGMQAKLDCAVNVREIASYNQSQLHLEMILPLMNVIFVRNGQLTVIPFPMKYLREYAHMIQSDQESNA